MSTDSKRAVVKPLATMIAIAAVSAPGTALAQERAVAERSAAAGERPQANERAALEREYRQVREKVVKRFGLRKAGRDLVRDGVEERDGDERKARKAEVLESIELMRGWLAPGETATRAPSEAVSGATTAAAGAPTSVIECESGGDYGAVNPAGYYGAYQFDQGTWDAYAPEGYAGTNPAGAPPAVQDAAAAAVPYDAWPNC